jgi:hypothetical protein
MSPTDQAGSSAGLKGLDMWPYSQGAIARVSLERKSGFKYQLPGRDIRSDYTDALSVNTSMQMVNQNARTWSKNKKLTKPKAYKDVGFECSSA